MIIKTKTIMKKTINMKIIKFKFKSKDKFTNALTNFNVINTFTNSMIRIRDKSKFKIQIKIKYLNLIKHTIWYSIPLRDNIITSNKTFLHTEMMRLLAFMLNIFIMKENQKRFTPLTHTDIFYYD